jgi:hypothetical protein
VELPFKCKSTDFTRIYQELYKNRITHEFIRNKLGLPDSVRLKLNGTFGRWLYLLGGDNCLYQSFYRVQTAVWFSESLGKWQYVSIFPNFIKKYCSPCLDILEYISCRIRKGEDVFKHIDDPEGILDCEDCITKPIRRIEKECNKDNYPALLNARYTDVYNRPLSISAKKVDGRFSILHNLVTTARQFFGMQHGVISLVNMIILL